MLIDSCGRTLDYLRVSITDRCNLRCVYCMPASGVEWKPHDSMLRFEEILRLCRIMAELGIRRIKLTGGEPLVRRGAAAFLKSLKAVPGIERVTLTTNGLLLDAYLDEAESLLPGSLPDGVNISVDALDPGRFRRITREEAAGPEGIIPLIERLREKRIPVKLNCVPVRGFNEDEIVPIAALARDRNIAVRFIELMPLGEGAGLKPVSGDETMAILEKAFGTLTPCAAGSEAAAGEKRAGSKPGARGGNRAGEDNAAAEEKSPRSGGRSASTAGNAAPPDAKRAGKKSTQGVPPPSGIEGNGPALYYDLPGFAGKIGFINPVSHGFCESCNRLRLTSEGFLRPCLSFTAGVGLREVLRSGADDGELARLITAAALKKPAFHNFSGVYTKNPPECGGNHSGGMFRIGG